MDNVEIRSLSDQVQLIQATEDTSSRLIEGYALLFEVESNDFGNFSEIIKRGAITQDEIDKCDVIALFDHDVSRGILARSTNGNGSLRLTVDDIGLKYSFEAPNTALGNEMVELLRRGDLRESSFSFFCEEDKWIKNGDRYLREIIKIKSVRDVSIVINPAYSNTNVSCRSYDNMLQGTKNEIKSYYEQLRSELYGDNN